MVQWPTPPAAQAAQKDLHGFTPMERVLLSYERLKLAFELGKLGDAKSGPIFQAITFGVPLLATFGVPQLGINKWFVIVALGFFALTFIFSYEVTRPRHRGYKVPTANAIERTVMDHPRVIIRQNAELASKQERTNKKKFNRLSVAHFALYAGSLAVLTGVICKQFGI